MPWSSLLQAVNEAANFYENYSVLGYKQLNIALEKTILYMLQQ